jgi:hypothetical protein
MRTAEEKYSFDESTGRQSLESGGGSGAKCAMSNLISYFSGLQSQWADRNHCQEKR